MHFQIAREGLSGVNNVSKIIIMSIYIGNDFEDRLKASEIENASLKKYNEYHQVVHEIDRMSDLHLESSFYKQSMKFDN